MESSNRNSGELWSYNEAKKKCNERYSCFVEVKAKEHMSLSPYYIGRIEKGVREQIERKIYCWRYVDEYQGIIVTYSNLKLLQRSAEIFDDAPFLHFDIQVDYIIFKPEVGKKLVGVVNKTSSSHVGCLVHGRFNASLAKPKACKNTWIGNRLAIGTEFLFRVASLQSVAGVLSINGEIKEKDSKHFRHAQQELLEDAFQLDTSDNSNQQKNLSKKKKKSKDNKDDSFPPENTLQLEDSLQLDTSDNSNQQNNLGKKKKKKRKGNSRDDPFALENSWHTEDSSQLDDSFQLDTSGNNNQQDNLRKKKKKKSKDNSKHKYSALGDSSQLDDSFQFDTSGNSKKQDNLSQKQKKKDKHNSSEINKSILTRKEYDDKSYHKASTDNSDIFWGSTSKSPAERNNLMKKSKKGKFSDDNMDTSHESGDKNNNTNHGLTTLGDYLPLDVSESDQKDVSKKKHKKSKEKHGESHKQQDIKMEDNFGSVNGKISGEEQHKLKRKHDSPVKDVKEKKKKKSK